MPPSDDWLAWGSSGTTSSSGKSPPGDSTPCSGGPPSTRYMWDDDMASYSRWDMLTLDGPRIAAVIAFVMPEVFTSFGLPNELSS